MGKSSILIAICLVAGLVLTVMAQVQESALSDAMKQNPALIMSLNAKIAANDAAGAAADAAKLEGIFKTAEDFMTEHKVADGVNWAKETRAAANDVVKAAKANNMEAAKAAAANVGKNCKACHMAHRMQDPQTKAFSFKP